MNRWEYRIIMGVLALVMAGLLTILTMTLFPYDILELPEVADLVNTTVKKGEDLKYIGYMYKKMDLPSRQECYFQDGIKYALPTRWTNREPGFYKEIVYIKIPSTLPTKTTYTYCCDIFYEPNIFQTKRYHWCSVPFEYVD